MGQMIPLAFRDNLVRAVERDGEPWFVGKDVCAVLDISKHHQALDRLDPDERGTCNVGTPSGAQDMIVVSEPGVYRLVFTSRKPEAEEFKRWLAHEVLPMLRKTGRFAPADEAPRPAAAGAEDALALLNWRLAAVKEARLLFGPARAAQMWGELGLPHVPAPPALLDAGQECLSLLLDTAWPDGEPPLRERLRWSLAHETDDPWFGARGVRLVYEDEPQGVIVANAHRALEALFAGTRWAGARWGRALQRLPGAKAAKPTRFGAETHRGTFLPAELIDGL